jgi:hypothetical protein
MLSQTPDTCQPWSKAFPHIVVMVIPQTRGDGEHAAEPEFVEQNKKAGSPFFQAPRLYLYETKALHKLEQN